MKTKIALLYAGLSRSNVLLNTNNHIMWYDKMFPRDQYELDLYMVTDFIDVNQLTSQMKAVDIHVKYFHFTDENVDLETMTIQLENVNKCNAHHINTTWGAYTPSSPQFRKLNIGISAILESGIQYDYIVKMRNDVLIYGMFELDKQKITHKGDLFFVCALDKLSLFLDLYKMNGSFNDLTLISGSIWDPQEQPGGGINQWLLAPETQFVLHVTKKANKRYEDLFHECPRNVTFFIKRCNSQLIPYVQPHRKLGKTGY